MRYMNWDALLFPNSSKVPLQEFKTGCYITQDPDPASNQAASLNGLPGSYSLGMPRYLPTVASFVPNIPLGSPLKISIHSWEAPIASPDTVTLAQQPDWIWFEARVLLDGICVAGVLFNQQAGWPQVIGWRTDTCSYPDKEGNATQLTFPAFHSEMLTQNYWNAGENFGRIKIVIAEGLIRGQGSAFEKTRSIVCFSFQHAPLRVLEDSGIAFPNPGMLYQLQNQIYGLTSPRKVQEPDPDAQGHSPRRRVNMLDSVQARMAVVPPLVYQDPTVSGLASSSHLQFAHPYWQQIPQAYDLFLGNGRYQAYGRRPTTSSSGDQSMPDYPHSLTPSSSRNISNNQDHQDPTAEVLTNVGTILDSCYYSPNRPASNGTVAPANTRVSSATNTPPAKNSKPSTAAEARASSHSNNQIRSVSVTTRDPVKSNIREHSDSSIHSRSADYAPEPIEITEGKIKKKPAKDVKGRKEGKVGEFGFAHLGQKKLSPNLAEHHNKENVAGSEDKSIGFGDGKRKRSTTSLSTISRMLSEGHADSSPSRKVSRIGKVKDHDLDDLTSDGVVARVPLGDVGNTL